jgi:processive 1,2-diacylglycerol beta-glucosyltransferase
MKILFTYASAGAGHRKAAQALFHYFKLNSKGLDLVLVDVLDKISFLYRIAYTYGYPFLINRASWGWRFGFWLTSVQWLRPITKKFSLLLDIKNSSALVKFFVEEKADLIVSTHFLPSEICALLKANAKINSRLITVVTDFDVHPFWVHKDTDVYVVASGFTKKQLISQGVDEAKIREYGIPVDPKFFKVANKNTILKSLNLKTQATTVLVVTGSFGIGPIEEIVDLLRQEVQLIVVCANNEKLRLSLKKKRYKNVCVLGFVDNIQDLMSVSDIIVTKPGGLTSVEVLAKELVPIFVSAIPGQETANAYALSTYGIGISAEDPEQVKHIVLDYKRHPEKIKIIQENMREIKKPQAARDLFYEVCPSSFRITG